MAEPNNSHLKYSFSKESAFSGSDVRAFIMPSFEKHNNSLNPIFKTPDTEKITQAITSGKNLDYYLNQSYITNLSGVSISTHQDKTPVTALGRNDPLGFVASRRTVAGSMIFWMSDASPISQLLSVEYRKELLHADELPPFDLYLTFLTENDMWSSTTIYGITILDEGMVVENANGEPIAVTYSYMALDSTPVVPGFFSNLKEINSTREKELPISKEKGTLTKTNNGLKLREKSIWKTISPSDPIQSRGLPPVADYNHMLPDNVTAWVGDKETGNELYSFRSE